MLTRSQILHGVANPCADWTHFPQGPPAPFRSVVLNTFREENLLYYASAFWITVWQCRKLDWPGQMDCLGFWSTVVKCSSIFMTSGAFMHYKYYTDDTVHVIGYSIHLIAFVYTMVWRGKRFVQVFFNVPSHQEMLTEERCDVLRLVVEIRSCERVAKRFKERRESDHVGKTWYNGKTMP